MGVVFPGPKKVPGTKSPEFPARRARGFFLKPLEFFSIP
jgi:hypothetical protein